MVVDRCAEVLELAARRRIGGPYFLIVAAERAIDIAEHLVAEEA